VKRVVARAGSASRGTRGTGVDGARWVAPGQEISVPTGTHPTIIGAYNGLLVCGGQLNPGPAIRTDGGSGLIQSTRLL
jgi:hypothetical protein